MPTSHQDVGESFGCDVCSRDMRPEDGFALTTGEITASEEFWRRTSETTVATSAHFSLPAAELAEIMPMSVEHFCADPTRWIVCDECTERFVIDLDRSRRIAQTGGTPDDVGPVAPEDRVAVAARASRQLTGHWPSTVRPVEEPVDTCDFCTKPVYGTEVVAHMRSTAVPAMVDRDVLPAPRGDPRPSSAGGDPRFLCCNTCLARFGARTHRQSRPGTT